MADFTMPSLGADMDAGTLVEWLIEPGDQVERGQIVAVVETQKGAIDVEIFESGEILELLVAEGTKVPVGTVLARYRRPGEDTSEPTASPGPSAAKSTPEPSEATAPEPSETPATEPSETLAPEPSETPAPVEAEAPAPEELAPTTSPELHPNWRRSPQEADTAPQQSRPLPGGDHVRTADHMRKTGLAEGEGHRAAMPPRQAQIRLRGSKPASPRAKRLAAEAGVDLDTLRGTGPEGSIIGDDVLAATRATPPRQATKPDARAAMRQAIAAAMSRSKRDIPHYYLAHSVDLERALGWLEAQNEALPITERLLPITLYLRAVAKACAAHEALNGWWRDGAFVAAEGAHVGMAVALRGGGLVNPALRDADQGSLAELNARVRDLGTRARRQALRASELDAASITVTSLGDRGVDAVFGIIQPPQVAIVGFGTVRLRPWVVDGAVVPRRLVELGLSGDHRASDGHAGARFLASIDANLQAPESL